MNITTTEFPELVASTSHELNILLTTRNLTQPVDFNNTSVKTQLALYDVLIPSLGCFIIVLNLMVVISSGLILKKGQQPRSTYLFLGNVAMTDLVTGVAVVFGQLYPKANRDHYICALQLGMIVASTLTSVYSVGLIAIDRFLYIIHGMQYQKWVYPTRARLLIVGTWLLGCLIGFMPLFGWYGDTDNGRICWFILLAPKELILLTVIMGIIPLLIVIMLYSIILYHAIKKIVQLQQSGRHGGATTSNLRMFRGGGANNTETEPVNEPKPKKTLVERIFKKQPSPTVKTPSKWKAIKVVLFTTGSFVITWSPYFIASIVYVYKCEGDDSKRCKNLKVIIASPLAILGFANSLINPVIYAWWHKGFRTYIKKRVNTVMMRSRRKNNSVGNSGTKSSDPEGSSSATKDKGTGNKAEKVQSDENM